MYNMTLVVNLIVMLYMWIDCALHVQFVYLDLEMILRLRFLLRESRLMLLEGLQVD